MIRRSRSPQRYRILAVGNDVSHLSSCANLLTLAGYRADIFLRVDDAVRRVLIRQYDLAIVGFAFARDDQFAVKATLRQVRENLPILLLSSEHDSPDAFLAAVADCLKQKKRFQFPTGLDSYWLDRKTG